MAGIGQLIERGLLHGGTVDDHSPYGMHAYGVHFALYVF